MLSFFARQGVSMSLASVHECVDGSEELESLWYAMSIVRPEQCIKQIEKVQSCATCKAICHLPDETMEYLKGIAWSRQSPSRENSDKAIMCFAKVRRGARSEDAKVRSALVAFNREEYQLCLLKLKHAKLDLLSAALVVVYQYVYGASLVEVARSKTRIEEGVDLLKATFVCTPSTIFTQEMRYDALNRAGCALIRLEKHEEALTVFQKLIKVESLPLLTQATKERAFRNVLELLTLLEKPKEAVVAARAVLTLRGLTPRTRLETRLTLIHQLFLAKKHTEALPILTVLYTNHRELLQYAPAQAPYTYIALATLLYLEKLYGESLMVCMKFMTLRIKSDKQVAEMRVLMALAQFGQGKYQLCAKEVKLFDTTCFVSSVPHIDLASTHMAPIKSSIRGKLEILKFRDAVKVALATGKNGNILSARFDLYRAAVKYDEANSFSYFEAMFDVVYHHGDWKDFLKIIEENYALLDFLRVLSLEKYGDYVEKHDEVFRSYVKYLIDAYVDLEDVESDAADLLLTSKIVGMPLHPKIQKMAQARAYYYMCLLSKDGPTVRRTSVLCRTALYKEYLNDGEQSQISSWAARYPM